MATHSSLQTDISDSESINSAPSISLDNLSLLPKTRPSVSPETRIGYIESHILNAKATLEWLLSEDGIEIDTTTRQQIAKSKNRLTKATKQLEKLQEEVISTTAHLTKQTQRIQDLNTQIDRIKPLPEELYSAVKAAIDAHHKTILDTTTQIKEITTKTNQLASENKALIEQSALATASTSTNVPNSQQTTPASTQPTVNEKKDPGPKYRRTIIITQIQNGARRLSGRDIQSKVEQAHITIQQGTIEAVRAFRYSFKILCTSEEICKTLKQELDNNQILLREFRVVRERVQMQKAFVLSVSEHFSEEEVSNSIKNQFALGQDEVQVLFSRDGRYQGTRNWAVIIPAPLLHHIIEKSKEIKIGLGSFRISPMTSLQRCGRCQGLGHHVRSCTATPRCVQCSLTHTNTEACQNQPCCINCKSSNINDNTNLSTAHPASSSNCPTYRQCFQLERERINALYYDNEATPPPEEYSQQPQHQQEPPMHPPPFYPPYQHYQGQYHQLPLYHPFHPQEFSHPLPPRFRRQRNQRGPRR